MKENKHYNIYDVLLFLMMALMIGGNAGGFFQLTRVLHLCLLPFAAYGLLTKSRDVLKRNLYPTIFLPLWIIYAAVGLIWAEHDIENYKWFIHLCIFSASLIEVLWLADKAKNPRIAILYGWVTMLVLTVPIAFGEFITDEHLSCCDNKPRQTTYYGINQAILRRFASITFDNINAYNMVLCYGLMPIMLFIYSAKKKWQEISGYTIWCVIGWIILLNASRAAIACLLASILLFIILADTRKQRILGGIGVLLFSAWFALDIAGFSVFPKVVIVGNGSNAPSSAIVGRISNQGVEDVERSQIYKMAWQITTEHKFMGCGTGNITHEMFALNKRYAAPHCLWLEVLMQFGIIIFLGFVGLYLSIFVRGIKTTLKTHKRFAIQATLLGLMLVAGASISDGTMLLKAPLWMMIASLYVLTDETYEKHTHEKHTHKHNHK